jgi:hypothetical protein
MAHLGPKQIEWLDEHLCLGRFKEFREQADKARSDTDEARRKMDARRESERKAA